MGDTNLTRKTRQAQLLESPVAALRRRNGLSREQAAADLGISLLRLARLEAATRRLPARTLRSIAQVLSPADRSIHVTLLDLIAELDRAEVQMLQADPGAGH